MSIYANTTYALKIKEETGTCTSVQSSHQCYSAALPTQLPLHVDDQAKYGVHLGFAVLPTDMAQKIYYINSCSSLN
jgi:hypothetical protein